MNAEEIIIRPILLIISNYLICINKMESICDEGCSRFHSRSKKRKERKKEKKVRKDSPYDSRDFSLCTLDARFSPPNRWNSTASRCRNGAPCRELATPPESRFENFLYMTLYHLKHDTIFFTSLQKISCKLYILYIACICICATIKLSRNRSK